MQRKSEVTTSERNDIQARAAKVRLVVADFLDAAHLGSCFVPFLDRIELFASMICLWGSRMNLTAEPDDPDQIAFHIIDSLTPLVISDREELLRPVFRAVSQILDLGSGAGFPGLVLAAASPAKFTLVESRRKRASFLSVAAAEMNLKNVTVILRQIVPDATNTRRYPSNDPADTDRRFDVVTARSYARPPAFYSAAASALRLGGIAILYANPGQNLVLDDARTKGLSEFRSVLYAVPRGRREAKRILGLWRRQ